MYGEGIGRLKTNTIEVRVILYRTFDTMSRKNLLRRNNQLHSAKACYCQRNEAGKRREVIYACTGNDFVSSAGGDDEVNAGPGADTVFSEAGSDYIEGGAGDDRFLFIRLSA